MQKIIKFKFGKYEIPLLYEEKSSKMKPMGIFSDLKAIPFHTDIKHSDIMEELFTQVTKKYQQISGPIRKLNYKPYFNYSKKEEKEGLCKKFKENEKKGEILGEGVYGVVRDFGPGTVAKTENCTEYNLFRNIKRNDPDYEDYFIKSSKLRLKILRPLIEKNLAPEIYEIEKCDNLCITIMEKIEGKTLRDTLEEYYNSEKYEPDKYSTIVRVIDAIIEFHQVMKDNGHKFGHGDLNSGNIMIEYKTGKVKFIDFVFEYKESFEDDWYHFFYGIRKFIRMDQLNRVYLQETGKKLEIESLEDIKNRVLSRRH